MTRSARWLQHFQTQLQRRQHIILHGNIHDQFLWRGDYTGLRNYFDTYFNQQGYDIVVHYDPIDGFQFAHPAMVQPFQALTPVALETVPAPYSV